MFIKTSTTNLKFHVLLKGILIKTLKRKKQKKKKKSTKL